MKSLTENSNQVYISKPQFVHRNGPEAGQSEASFFQHPFGNPVRKKESAVQQDCDTGWRRTR